MEEYPDDSDIKVVIEDKFGLEDMQYHLQQNSNLLVHTNAKEDMSMVARRSHLGYQNLHILKRKVMEIDAKTKSTAFYINSEATNQDLFDDLESLKRSSGNNLNENIELTITKLRSDNDDSFSIELGYKRKRSTRRNFLNTEDKSITIRVEPEMAENTRIANVNYRKIDEFRAVIKFLDGWRSLRIQQKQDPIQIIDVDLTALPLDDRVKLFNDFFVEHPGNWKFDHVSELGIEREEDDHEDLSDEEQRIVLEERDEIEAELDQRLGGLTNAILRGREGLLESSFVKDCLERDFYFNSATAFFTNKKGISAIEMSVNFKQSPRPSFAISFEDYYEKGENGYVSRPVADDEMQDVRDLFRGVIMNLYAGRTNQNELIRKKYTKPLTELKGIGQEIANRLSEDLDIYTPTQVFAADPEELQKVEGIGEQTAKSLVRD